MEEAWRYQRGAWSRMESPVEFYDESGEQLDAPPGYSARTRWFGADNEFEVEVYSAEPESELVAPTPYLVMVYNVGNNIERVFVEDFPSLMQFLADMAGLLSLPTRGWEPTAEFSPEESNGQEQD